MAKAIFAGGCFWGMEELIRVRPGILGTRVGYTGGHVSNPTYQMVCTKTTGHAEAIEIEYDETVTSYRALLEFFFQIHDPTTLDREKWLPRFQRPLIFGKLNQNIRTICNDIPGATRAISSGITGYYRSLNFTHNSLKNFLIAAFKLLTVK